MSSANKLIVKNSIYLLSRTVILTAISLYTVREVLHLLGAEGYGLFSLIFGLVTLFAFINGAMTSATQRFISIEIGKKNSKGITESFFASLLIHVTIGLFLLFFLLLLKDFILLNFLNVENFHYEANYIYMFACANIVITFIQSVFIALITSYERMKIFSYISLFEGGLKLLIVYALYLGVGNTLIVYSGLFCFSSLLCLILYLFYSSKLIKSDFDLDKIEIKNIFNFMKDMKGFMGWSLIGNIAWVGKNQGLNILLNLFFGILMNAAYAIAIGLASIINNLLASVSNAIKPQIYKKYASGEYENFYNLITFGTKYYMFILILFIIPITFSMEKILNLWLKDIPNYAIDFSILALVLVLFESYSLLLIAAVQATGKIVANQLMVGGILILNLPISYFFLKNGYDAKVIYHVAIVLTFLALLVKLIILEKVSKYRAIDFVKYVFIPNSIFLFLVSIIFYYIGYLTKNLNIFNWLLFLIFGLCVCLILLYMFFLNSFERGKINSYIFSRVKG